MRPHRLFGLIFLFVMLCAQTMSAQDEIIALYLGREDSNLDGQISPQDVTGVFAATADGQSARVSAADEAVLSYRASADLSQIAYVVAEPTGLTLHVTAPTAAEYELDGLTLARVEQVDAQIWLSGRDDAELTVLVGVDPTNGTQVELVLDASALIAAFDPSGNWVLLFSESSQRVQLAALPSLEISDVQTAPLILGVPSWSPSGDRFAYVGAADDGSGLALSVVEAATGVTTQIPLPASAGVQSAGLLWSDSGTLVAVKLSDAAQDTAVVNPLHIVNVTAGTLQTLQESTTYFDPIRWSPNDQSLLVSTNQTLPDGFVFYYQLYDVASDQLRTLDTLGLVNPTYFTWRPATQSLWLLGTPLTPEQSGILSLDTADDALSIVLATDGTALLGGSLLWGSGGQSLVVLATEVDPIAQLLGVGYALYRYDEAGGALVRLSPTTVAPLPFGVQVK
jgi:dipeptidyl aminopeptidase/acylaminoacyl peptidase